MKFQVNLNRSHSQIKETRATRIAKRAASAQSELINALEKQLDSMLEKLEDLTDLAPETTVSLNVTKGEFDADAWVNTVQETKIDIMNKKMEIQVAKETQKEFFTPSLSDMVSSSPEQEADDE